MPDPTQRPRILLAVEATDCDAAVRVAAEQARVRRCGVHVVHVVPPAHASEPDTTEGTRIAADLHRKADRLLIDLADRLKRLLDDDLPVTTELSHGPVVESLAAAGNGAEVLVLQHRRTGRRGRSPLLSVIPHVVAHTHAPVLVVPEGWQPGRADGAPVVTVGLPTTSGAHGLIRAALHEAERIGARLRVLHAVDEEHEVAVENERPAEARAVSSRRAAALRLRQQRLQEAARDVAAERPDVPVEVLVVAGSPVHALARASKVSSCVIVGRRHSHHGPTTHLAPVVSGLLGRSACPVLVLDPLKTDDVASALDSRPSAAMPT